LLKAIVSLLAEGKPLAEKHRDHALSGKFSGFRECHITPDWLLVYMVDNEQ
jgi:mRNA interferase YafQ